MAGRREGKEKQRISSLISTYHLYIIYIQLKSVKKALYPEVLDVRDDMGDDIRRDETEMIQRW